ncbi:hypothetical protein HOY82DRAFT_536658 [Tuber indicum]|nr:hypothetical protein HOY82DRAFT_536658 [Tuber indicum]
MTSASQSKPGQESQSTSLLSSPPLMSSPSAPVTPEMSAASGPSTILKKRHAGSASNSKQPTKRSRPAEEPAVRNTKSKDEDRSAEIWQPWDLGGGRPPILYGKPISMNRKNCGAWWRCVGKGCLAVVPGANTTDGRALIINHLQEHCSALRNSAPGVKGVPRVRGNSIQFVPTKYSAFLFCTRYADRMSRPIPDEIKDLLKVGRAIRAKELEKLTQITYTVVELKRQREKELALAAESTAEKEAGGDFAAQAEASKKMSNDTVGKGNGKY